MTPARSTAAPVGNGCRCRSVRGGYPAGGCLPPSSLHRFPKPGKEHVVVRPVAGHVVTATAISRAMAARPRAACGMRTARWRAPAEMAGGRATTQAITGTSAAED